MLDLPPRIISTAAIVLLVVSGCSRPPDLIGITKANAPVALVEGITGHSLFIISTRAVSERTGALYSGQRSSALGLASVEVTIPPNHVRGKTERPRRLPPDPKTEITVIKPVVYGTKAAFLTRINKALDGRPRNDRKVLLFVHGYNTTTSDATVRLAQFVHDAGYGGVPVLFTWASAASAPRYVYDLNSALVAREKLDDIASILNDTRSEGIDIFAHSMGALLTMEGLVNAALEGRLASMRRIRHIVLAAPDIDIDLFRTQLLQLPESLRKKIYVLTSHDDAALRFSRTIAGGVPRVGAADEAQLEKLGLTVIDVSDVSHSFTGAHSKFAGSPEVVQVIGEGLAQARGFGLETNPTLERLLNTAPIRILGND